MSAPGLPVCADDAVMTKLVREFEHGDAPDMADYARKLGVLPPDHRTGWSIVHRWGPSGRDLGLYWVNPADCSGRSDQTH